MSLILSSLLLFNDVNVEPIMHIRVKKYEEFALDYYESELNSIASHLSAVTRYIQVILRCMMMTMLRIEREREREKDYIDRYIHIRTYVQIYMHKFVGISHY